VGRSAGGERLRIEDGDGARQVLANRREERVVVAERRTGKDLRGIEPVQLGPEVAPVVDLRDEEPSRGDVRERDAVGVVGAVRVRATGARSAPPSPASPSRTTVARYRASSSFVSKSVPGVTTRVTSRAWPPSSVSCWSATATR